MKSDLAASPPAVSASAGWITSLACAGFLAASLAVYGIAAIAPAQTGTAYIVLHGLMTAAMLAAWRWGGAVHLPLILFTGLAARILLIPAPMLSSNDSERYLWDGAVALAGFDPYSVAPADQLVTGLRAMWATPPEHAAYPTLYPPVALSLFGLAALAGPVWGIWVWKLIASIAGIALVPLALRLLRRRRLDRHIALVALSPLLVLETGVGAHIDSVVALIVTAALLAFDARRPVWVGVLLGLGIGVKLLPGAVLAALVVAAGWRGGARMAGAAIATVGGVYGLAFAGGWRPIGSLPVFFEKWRNGSPLFTLLEAHLSSAGLLAMLGALAVVAGVAVLVVARKRPVIGAQIALATPLILSPVAFPWYLSALVPLSAVAPSATVLIWLSTSPLIYEVRDQFVSEGVWMPALWPLIVIGAGWVMGAGIDARRELSRPKRRERHADKSLSDLIDTPFSGAG